MSQNNNMKFSKGLIEHEVLSGQNAEAVINKIGDYSKWTGGYFAFSRGECSKDMLGDIDIISKLLGNNRFNPKTNPLSGFPEADGYLMEVGLWREEGNIVEEIHVEREDSGFFVQTWKLIKNPEVNDDEHKVCYYRLVNVLPRGNSNIKDAISKVYEVILPLKRLHFFIMAGGDKSGSR